MHQRISTYVILAATGLLHGCYLPANSGGTPPPSQPTYQPSYASTDDQPQPYYAQPAPYRPSYEPDNIRDDDDEQDIREHREHREHREYGGRRLAQKECKSDFGRTVCGFHCASGFGNVQCANTPAGACDAAFGRITCWDPPGADTRYEPDIHAECKSAFGRTECGYGCAEGFGRVQCATRPGGVCQAAYGNITCVEP